VNRAAFLKLGAALPFVDLESIADGLADARQMDAWDAGATGLLPNFEMDIEVRVVNDGVMGKWELALARARIERGMVTVEMDEIHGEVKHSGEVWTEQRFRWGDAASLWSDWLPSSPRKQMDSGDTFTVPRFEPYTITS
jgi:hypothetical protein